MLKDDEMMYVPLLDSLQLLLNKPSIVYEVSIVYSFLSGFNQMINNVSKI